MAERKKRKKLDSDKIDDITPERRAKFRKKDDSSWLDAEEWPRRRATVVCSTVDCPMRGVGVDVTLFENVDGVYRASCGPCGQPITDMYEAA